MEPDRSFTTHQRAAGRIAAYSVVLLLLAYVPTTILGFLSLRSPQDPIGDPYFAIMELLIIAMSPFLVLSMVAVHAYASPEAKLYSLTALLMMTVLAGLTTSVHFMLLTVGRQFDWAQESWAPLIF